MDLAQLPRHTHSKSVKDAMDDTSASVKIHFSETLETSDLTMLGRRWLQPNRAERCRQKKKVNEQEDSSLSPAQPAN